jgi:hypothetical protein
LQPNGFTGMAISAREPQPLHQRFAQAFDCR